MAIKFAPPPFDLILINSLSQMDEAGGVVVQRRKRGRPPKVRRSKRSRNAAMQLEDEQEVEVAAALTDERKDQGGDGTEIKEVHLSHNKVKKMVPTNPPLPKMTTKLKEGYVS